VREGASIVGKLLDNRYIDRTIPLQVILIAFFARQEFVFVRFIWSSLCVRSTKTAGGRALFELVQLLWKRDPLSDGEIDFIIDTINSRVCTTEEVASLMKFSPRAVVLRNILKPILGLHLAKNHAQQLGRRLTIWRSTDRGDHHGALVPLSRDFANLLGTQEPAKTGDLDTWLCFFEGCQYIFSNNSVPSAGWFNNGTCTGVKLLVDALEPADSGDSLFRNLHYPPVGIVVRPNDAAIGDLFRDENVPSGCVPVVKIEKEFTVSRLYCELYLV